MSGYNRKRYTTESLTQYRFVGSGLTVWYGGPLDPRLDPSLTDEDLVADPEFTTDAGTHHDDSRSDR